MKSRITTLTIAAVAALPPAGIAAAQTPAASGQISASACTAENATAAGATFTPLPAGWHYAVSDAKGGEQVSEFRNLQPETVNVRHADRWVGTKAATATCTPTDAKGKGAAKSPAFAIMLPASEPVRAERVIVCANGQPMSGWTGKCPLIRVNE